MKKIFDKAMRVYVVREHWSPRDGYRVCVHIGRFGIYVSQPIDAFQIPNDEFLRKKLEEICCEDGYLVEDCDGSYETGEG